MLQLLFMGLSIELIKEERREGGGRSEGKGCVVHGPGWRFVSLLPELPGSIPILM